VFGSGAGGMGSFGKEALAAGEAYAGRGKDVECCSPLGDFSPSVILPIVVLLPLRLKRPIVVEADPSRRCVPLGEHG
jgi:hypothetical protein